MRIAKTLKNILENPIVRTSLDRSKPIDGIVREVQAEWAADLLNRRPAPAYTEYGMYKGTDLDLFTVMNALAQREAVINIPQYENNCATKIRGDQRVISKHNRHGQVFGLIPNAKVHTFSARIKDYNVIQTLPNGKEEVGAFRNFTLVDPSGKMYDGWKTIETKFTPAEDKLFHERKVYSFSGIITVHNFVHPNLGMALYGARHWETKSVANRITDEAKFYRGLAGVLRNAGVKLGEAKFDQPGNAYNTYTVRNDNFEKVKVKTLESKLVLPEPIGEYPIVGEDKFGRIQTYSRVPNSRPAQENILRFAENRSANLSYKIGPKINAPVRAVELAFLLYGFQGGQKYAGREKMPSWNVPDWTREYKEGPTARTEWNALEVGQAALLYRIKDTTVTVKA